MFSSHGSSRQEATVSNIYHFLENRRTPKTGRRPLRKRRGWRSRRRRSWPSCLNLCRRRRRCHLVGTCSMSMLHRGVFQTDKLDVPLTGVDPKTILCSFFKVGQCQKGAKCKFSHDVNVERKAAKVDLYTDKRDTKDGWYCVPIRLMSDLPRNSLAWITQKTWKRGTKPNWRKQSTANTAQKTTSTNPPTSFANTLSKRSNRGNMDGSGNVRMGLGVNTAMLYHLDSCSRRRRRRRKGERGRSGSGRIKLQLRTFWRRRYGLEVGLTSVCL